MKIGSTHTAVTISGDDPNLSLNVVFWPDRYKKSDSPVLNEYGQPIRVEHIYGSDGVVDVPENIGGKFLHIAGANDNAGSFWYVQNIQESEAPLGIQDIIHEPSTYELEPIREDLPQPVKTRGDVGRRIPNRKKSLE